jgi:hypothetical protein
MIGLNRAIAPGPEIIAVTESAWKHDHIRALQIAVLMPEVDTLFAEHINDGDAWCRSRSWIRGR